MKLGLCICYYNHNYGSMLQAYATIKEIEKRNIEYSIIAYEKDWKFFLKNINRIFNKTWRSEKKLVVQKKISSYQHFDYKINRDCRDKCFNEFQRDFFESKLKKSKGYKQLIEDAYAYNAVLVGSDQMWSPSGLSTNFYNLMFVPNGIRRISYASSFGVAKIPQNQNKKTAEYLNKMDFISVRENRACEIVKALTGKRAVVAVDPTMLLSKAEWEEFSGQNKIVDEPYIFAYFLGTNQKHREKVNELKQHFGLKVVTLRHLDEYVESDEKFGDFAPYNIGPKEFINLIKNADYICTDSFHGTVFATIFHKKFITFSRYSDESKISKNSRIDSLLVNLGIEKRKYSNGEIVSQMIENIDYETLEKKRKSLIDESKLFLDKALGGL